MKYAIFSLLLVIFLGCRDSVFTDRKNDQQYVFDSYWKEIDRNYSFFSYTHVNWDSVYATVRPLVGPDISNDSLFNLLVKTTNILHDAHTNVYAPQGIGGNIDYFDTYRENQITLNNDVYFEYYVTDRIFEYGKLKNVNTGYIKIKTFEGTPEDFEKIDSIFLILDKTEKLILDVRSNFGGEISNSKIVASRLADSTHYVGQYRVRNGPSHDNFSDWINIFISPVNNGIHINKPVTILTNRRSYSATEWFVLFTAVLPQVKTVGDTTGGGSAMPLFRELPNGWLLRISNTQIKTPAGRDFQNTGLFPDVPIWISLDDEEKGIDTILEKAK